jgi:hypothetical protein
MHARRLSIIRRDLNFIPAAQTDAAVALRWKIIFDMQLKVPIFRYSPEIIRSTGTF